jgi:hypothetical protein
LRGHSGAKNGAHIHIAIESKLAHPGCGNDARQSFPEVSSSREFSFEPVDFAAEPLLEDLLAIAWIQAGDCSALMIERDMVTRNIFSFAGLWNVLNEEALAAWMTPQWIAEIQAGERVPEWRCGFVWRTN